MQRFYSRLIIGLKNDPKRVQIIPFEDLLKIEDVQVLEYIFRFLYIFRVIFKDKMIEWIKH